MKSALSPKLQKMQAEAPYVEQLRKELTDRMRQIWNERFKDLGPSLEEVVSRNALYEALRDEVNQRNAERLGRRKAEGVTISKDTVRRLLSPPEGPDARGYYGPTKDALAHYLGYEGWASFLAHHVQNLGNHDGRNHDGHNPDGHNHDGHARGGQAT